MSDKTDFVPFAPAPRRSRYLVASVVLSLTVILFCFVVPTTHLFDHNRWVGGGKEQLIGVLGSFLAMFLSLAGFDERRFGRRLTLLSVELGLLALGLSVVLLTSL